MVAAECDEGFGAGPGEVAFRNALRGGTTPPAVLAQLRGTGVAAGGQRAYMVARALGVARFQRAVRHWVAAVQPDIVMACDAEAAWAVGTGRRPGQRC